MVEWQDPDFWTGSSLVFNMGALLLVHKAAFSAVFN
jgi:hypothetical protein